MTTPGNPQLENGYTRIANEILDALPRLRVPAECWRVLMVIFRKTYGWGKKSDRTPLSQFCLATGMKKQNVSRALKKLEKMGVIIIHGDDRKPKTYQFNKNYASWDLSSNEMTGNLSSNRMTAVIQSDDNLSSNEMTSKEKRNFSKEMPGKPDPIPEKSENGIPPYSEIISFLNSQTGKNFRTNTKSTRRFIRARWREKYRLDDFKAVITRKTTAWKGDRKMDSNLRPETLFGTKFESYLNERDPKPVTTVPEYQNLSEVDVYAN